MTILDGVGSASLLLCALRIYLGVFMILARFRWFYDPSRPEDPWFNDGRHISLHKTVSTCGFTHWALAATVAIVEMLAGLALVFGLMTVPAAFGLLVILLVATWCKGGEKTAKQEPVDRIDWVSCYLWTPEPGYIMVAFAILVLGPGMFSLDHILEYDWSRVWTATFASLLVLGFILAKFKRSFLFANKMGLLRK